MSNGTWNRAAASLTLMLAIGTTSPSVLSADAADPQDAETKALSGMSILGNSEAPKSLVIVPWKTSELGDGIGVSNLLDGRARPVDRDVFLRELDFYELRRRASATGTASDATMPDA